MNLRKLELEDAPLMLEWMHDKLAVKDLQANFAEKSLADCESFIKNSHIDKENLHLAIVDETDTYMGTVSLKHIVPAISAEFAIAVRKCAMGKGFSKYAMAEMIRIGIGEMKLKNIYWFVSPNNKRAIRFYDKNGYQKIDADKLNTVCIGNSLEQISDYVWYQIKAR